jgi:hypothetical protein
MAGRGSVADPRAGDVAEAERLFAQAAAEGAVALPSLSAAELWVLCGTDQVLADEQEARWWNALGEQRQRNVATAMLDLLAHRELVRPAGGGMDQRDMPMAPALAMIVAARRYPAVVAVGTREDGSTDVTPRMYGLGETGGPLRAVVGEYVSRKSTEPFELGPLHNFSLLSPERAGHSLALWAAEAPVSRGQGWRRLRRGTVRIVDFYRYIDGERQARDRITVTGSDGQHMVTRQRPGIDAEPEPPVACDLGGLAGLLTGMLREE